MGNKACYQSLNNQVNICLNPDQNTAFKPENYEYIEPTVCDQSAFQEGSTPLKDFINQHQNEKTVCATNNLYFSTIRSIQGKTSDKEEIKSSKTKHKGEKWESQRCSIQNNKLDQFKLTVIDFLFTDQIWTHNYGRIQINQEKFIHLRRLDVKKYYKFLEIVGEGSFGSVYRAICTKTQEQRAIKVIKKERLENNNKSEVFAQLELLKKMDHPNIIKLYEVFENRERYHVVTEYCKGGSIIDFIKQRKHFDENMVKMIMKQLLGCLNYLHTLRIVHRDIKLENVVFINKLKRSSVEEIQIKLLDFGTAYKMTKSKIKCSELVGTLSYMAPEFIKGYFTDKCDLWSCGVILHILLTSKSPFKCKKKEGTINKIMTHQLDFEDQMWSEIDENAKDLVIKLLERDLNKRISANAALKHPWFSNCKQKITAKNSDFINNLSNYYRENNLISVLQSYLIFSKVSQQERKRISLLFKQLDCNNDGVIQKNELIQAYKEANSGADIDEIQYVLNKIDKDKTGSINLNEFSSVMVNREKLFAKQALESAFDYFAKGTGYIEMKSLSKLLEGSDSKEIEKLISELDENRDKKVSKEEFLHYLLRKGCLY